MSLRRAQLRRHSNASRVDTAMPPASTQQCLRLSIARLAIGARIADVSPSVR
ncbi:hypothetical protein L211DRAFT_838463 [Terfezia boudieri ATCC MYA-4762]|uniref:Uncharacterized protein n=1 Tax=Terfezia boudieri ATCC MYA-4762 TaxID=1051890 RepID=A0A3N4LQS3_9PEZI|nr:hypothetical protein L211DRAFT_838463 [Terfezia boudieri ATCC MYA-4762]